MRARHSLRVTAAVTVTVVVAAAAAVAGRAAVGVRASASGRQVTGAQVRTTPGQRLEPQRRPIERPSAVLAIELEDLVDSIKPSAGTIARQDMQGFGPGWSGGQLFWRAPAPVDAPIRNWPHLSFLVTAPADGQYHVVLRHTAAPDFATFRVFLDGQPVADVDAYSPSVTPRARDLGQRTLAKGSHQVTITVFGKAPASSNFFVGLDRLELRPPEATAADVIGNPGSSVMQGGMRGGPASGRNMQALKPEQISRAICAANPEACCPAGASATEGCRQVTQSLLDIRIRSYVPPRFTVMGRHYPWDTDAHLANIVSDVSVSGGPYTVWPGCRFNVTEANNAINDSKTILEQAGALLEAWLAQWSGGVESAKNWVSQGVANEVCKIVDDSQSCRDTLAPIVKTGINLGISALGIPPEIPDIQQLREHGIRYLASQAASYALGDPAFLDKLPLDEKTREWLYQQAYTRGLDVLTKELNKAIPSTKFTPANPATWGHLEPAYAPHHAHLYIEVRVKPGAYAKFIHFLALKPSHTWQPLYLHDLNHVYASVGPIPVPAFIPQEGVILPVELKPYELAATSADDAYAQIPGVKISRSWLQGKFGIAAADGLVRAQLNWLPNQHPYYWFSEWDLFYMATGKASFRLLMPVGKGVLDLEKDWIASVGSIRDAEIGSASTFVLTSTHELQPYYGRIDPQPRCDGKPSMVALKPGT